MTALTGFKSEAFLLATILIVMIQGFARSQENPEQTIAFEDYAGQFIEQDEAFQSKIEEWREMIDQWLEKPLCINNEEADLLMEYEIINLYQLNKLKEYRLIYGDLLSLYELAFIDGWDSQTIRKVAPLVSAGRSENYGEFKKFSFSAIRQDIILKTSFNTQKSKGYERISTDENPQGDPVYTGSPVKLALRYDLEYRNKFSLGFRIKKDPGEPFLISPGNSSVNIKTPDLFSGYLQINRIGPFRSIILGNYRVSFGYGVNMSGGQFGMSSRAGMPGMAHHIRPQTSVSENGFFRGAAICTGSGRFSLTLFASIKDIDGTSLVTDSLSGKPVSFSSINSSGLHRTTSEISNRKSIREKVIGGYLVYRNNWLKTGIIAMYNCFNAAVSKSSRPYAAFGFTGKENLVTGMSATIWLPKVQLFTEVSMSRNKGTAIISGLQLMPVPGTLVLIAQRSIAAGYQNWHGSGISSNAGEKGLQASIRTELPKGWLVEFMTDISRTTWASYDMEAPSKRSEIKALTEKAWPRSRRLTFTFRYLNEAANDPNNSSWISHPVEITSYRFRLESIIEATNSIGIKSRIECSLVNGLHPGWLIFQDIEFAMARLKAKFWLRASFFDVANFGSRIYAYENDVLYDFTTFSYYGKGVRGILLARFSLADWLDIWLRISTIYYTNKQIGSGWDEINGNRQNEIEFQVRVKLPG
jgi:hypothetical protein